MSNNFTQAREAEINYHEKFYNETSLFQPGTWLSKPVQVVMDLLEHLHLNQISVLDLGCGVGRNSIHIKSGEILIERCTPQAIREKKQGKDIEFRSHWLTFAARRRSGII